MVGALPGLLMVFVGILSVMLVQIGRAAVDTAEMTGRECQVFCVWLIGSMLPERSKDNDDFQRAAGRTVEGLRAA